MIAAVAAAAVFAVAPGGDDAGPGTAERPWRTVAHAARTAPPGSTVEIAAGTYPGDVKVGDGLTLRGPEAAIEGRIVIRGRRDVTLEGLEVRGLRGDGAGVLVIGRSSRIALRGLEVHDIRSRGDAHGIAVYGNKPIRAVAIEDSHVHDLELGSSEAIVVNGDVSDWSVTGNVVEDVDNIGIDAIGFEGVATRRDRARDGLIAGNAVTGVDTTGNPKYAKGCRCAAGIYVDGGRDIVIERNRVEASNFGIELASEARRGSTERIVARGNTITGSDGPGLLLGGYDRRRGRTRHVRVEGNVLTGNDRRATGGGEILLQHRVTDSSFRDNAVTAGEQGLLLGSPFRSNRRNVFAGNRWAAPGDGRWQWRGRLLRGFAAWQDASGGDAGGDFVRVP